MNMNQRIKSFLYSFDLIGPSPQLYVYNKKRYNSILSSIISILILSLSIFYAICSIILFLRFDNPSISFSKDNDLNTNRSILLKDVFLIFQLFEASTNKPVSTSDVTFEGFYRLYYFNGTITDTIIDLETCELGKNVDVKFQNLTNDLKKIGRTLDQFHCLNTKYGNLSLFHHPQIGFSTIYVYPILSKNSIYTPEQLQSLIGSEINIINHEIKGNPFKELYIFEITNNYCSTEFTYINYNLQFIKYETDEGLFFKRSKILNGISFSDMTFYKNIVEDYNLEKNFQIFNKSKIGSIAFSVNKAHFDYYKRSYQKIQSLLAEIMSVVNLLFEIGRQISYILLNKLMSKDVFSSVIYKEKDKNRTNIKNINKNSINKAKSTSINNLFDSNKKGISFNDEVLNKFNSEKNNLDVSQKTIDNEKFTKKNQNKKIIKDINYCHVLQSFICFKYKRSKIINYINCLIVENFSKEKIFEKFYKFDIVYTLLSNEKNNKMKIYKNKRWKEINKFIYDVYNNSDITKNNNYIENNKKNKEEDLGIK